MCEIERQLKVQSFFVMDENFLLQRPRAMELLERMKEHNKAWALYVFSSANAIQKYTMEELVGLGVSWIWMGLESPQLELLASSTAPTPVELARELREHGIKLLGSTIVGLEHHTPENIRDEIEYAISHETDFHQFMLYTPVPGTPLYHQMEAEGRMLDVDLADIHGQYKFNFQHAAIDRDESKKILDWAFLRDFERQRPERLPHLPHHVRRLAALQEPSGTTCPGALRPRHGGALNRPTAGCCGRWSASSGRRMSP